MGSGDINSDAQACKIRDLSTEPSPQLFLDVLHTYPHGRGGSLGAGPPTLPSSAQIFSFFLGWLFISPYK